MKTIFDLATRKELIARAGALTQNNKAQWGKMTIYQMLKHCILAEEMYLGKKPYDRVLLGRIIGKMVLKNLLKDERPMGRNAPTNPALKIKQTGGDFEVEKTRWIQLLEEYEHFSNHGFVHWFFGNMTKEEIGWFVYKHADHHLRQFNG